MEAVTFTPWWQLKKTLRQKSHSLSHQIPQEWWDKGCVYCSHNIKKTITAKTMVDFQCKWSHSTQWKKKSRHWVDRVYFLALSTWTSLNAGVNLTRQEKPSGLGKSYHGESSARKVDNGIVFKNYFKICRIQTAPMLAILLLEYFVVIQLLSHVWLSRLHGL